MKNSGDGNSKKGLFKGEQPCAVVPYGLPNTKKHETMNGVKFYHLRVPSYTWG
jgi:hypothetical protein